MKSLLKSLTGGNNTDPWSRAGMLAIVAIYASWVVIGLVALIAGWTA